jgi:RimJ/RimL family protein N-acetyltransferase
MELKTKQLILRQFTIDDPHHFAWLMADPEVIQFSLSGSLAKEKAQVYLQKRILDHYAQYGYGLYAVEKKSLSICRICGDD